MASTLRTVLIAVLLVCAVTGAGIVVARFHATRTSPSSVFPALRPVVAPTRPAARDQSYVGSQACAECHQQIFEQFTTSPMGQSMATVAEAVQVENYDECVVKPSEYRHYRVTRDADSMTHDELMLDNQGMAYHEQSEKISYVVGSGQRGRSYLIDREGLLFQSPVGWYADGQRWDLSPGYTPTQHARFSRRIGDGCLYCHAGRMRNQGLASDRYEEPIFVELAIGCERCHGPGEQHVQIHSNIATAPAEDRIINPADLPVSKRESVCNQCHLLGRSVIPRYGRQFFDFRPGDDFEDIFVVLSQETDVELHGKLKAVNQVEQMRASQCYKASGGRLGCISCHDAHSVPTVEQRAEHYRLRCLSCHETEGCSLDLASRQEPPANNSCIHCHMPALATLDVPHTSLTDHRILRTPAEMQSTDEQRKNSPSDLTVFDHSGDQLPRAEVERARGITLMTTAWNRRDEHLAATALSHLSEALNHEINERLVTSDDIPLLDELAAGYLLLRDVNMAEACWKRMRELDTNSETALMGLAKVSEQRQDLQALGECLDKVLALNPMSEDALALLVKQRHYSKDAAGAVQAAERLLEINPTNSEMRSWLVGAYRQQGNADKVQEHEAFLSKMGVARPDAASGSTN